MSMPLIVMPEAEEDIAAAKAWYSQQRAGLGEDFLLCVEEALDRIGLFPQAASEVFPGVRRVVLRRFPYGVFYRVDSEQLAVIAVYDCRRNPRGWQQRI